MSFIVYSKENCPYCAKIKEVFNTYKLNYVNYTLDRDFTRDEFYSEFGEGSTFPQVVLQDTNNLDETKLGGCLDTIKYLKETMYGDRT